jgi:DNA-binding NarL/FixJ family response regulator
MRRIVTYELRNIPEIKLIAEASDAPEAVQLAKQLQPDLIVLDIGLPTQNGIEAAGKILEFSPRSKILFLSQELSYEIIHKALATGAKGYVCKMHLVRFLLMAVKAILRGETAVMAG